MGGMNEPLHGYYILRTAVCDSVCISLLKSGTCTRLVVSDAFIVRSKRCVARKGREALWWLRRKRRRTDKFPLRPFRKKLLGLMIARERQVRQQKEEGGEERRKIWEFNAN